MRLSGTIVLVGVLAGAVAPRAVALAPSAPAAAPVDPDIAALIAKLGSPDYRVRRGASLVLKKYGPLALPALREAQNSPDPEIRLRSTQILHLLERRPLPGRPPGRRASSVTIVMRNGRRTLEINDGGREIRVARGSNGITMTVSGMVDGRPATETYRARDADDLRIRHPDAFALYQRWNGGALEDAAIDPFMVRGNMLIPPIGPLGPGQLILPPQVMPGGDDLFALRLKLKREMARANLTADQRQHLTVALDRLDAAHRLDADDDPDRHIAKYNAASDALRQAIQDAHLGDPGDALPPPASARLGISAPGDDAEGGVRISHVMPHSRAERAGLQIDDLIRAVNGHPVRSVKDLRQLVTENPKGVVFEIVRDGEDLKLREK